MVQVDLVPYALGFHCQKLWMVPSNGEMHRASLYHPTLEVPTRAMLFHKGRGGAEPPQPADWSRWIITSPQWPVCLSPPSLSTLCDKQLARNVGCRPLFCCCYGFFFDFIGSCETSDSHDDQRKCLPIWWGRDLGNTDWGRSFLALCPLAWARRIIQKVKYWGLPTTM